MRKFAPWHGGNAKVTLSLSSLKRARRPSWGITGCMLAAAGGSGSPLAAVGRHDRDGIKSSNNHSSTWLFRSTFCIQSQPLAQLRLLQCLTRCHHRSCPLPLQHGRTAQWQRPRAYPWNGGARTCLPTPTFFVASHLPLVCAAVLARLAL